MRGLRRRTLLVVFLVVVAIVIYLRVLVPYLADAGPFQPPAVPSAHPVVTRAQADRIRGGMSYQQVVAIIGSKGRPVSRFRAGPLPPFTPRPNDYPEYEWRNSDGSNLRVTCHNGRVTGIAFFWLR